jgi:hypothetical protein
MSNKNKVFETPIRSMYQFYNYDRIGRSATPTATQVDVLEESEKRFKIRVLDEKIEGHKRGDIMWVQKTSIIFPKSALDYTNAPWNND